MPVQMSVNVDRRSSGLRWPAWRRHRRRSRRRWHQRLHRLHHLQLLLEIVDHLHHRPRKAHRMQQHLQHLEREHHHLVGRQDAGLHHALRALHDRLDRLTTMAIESCSACWSTAIVESASMSTEQVRMKSERRIAMTVGVTCSPVIASSVLESKFLQMSSAFKRSMSVQKLLTWSLLSCRRLIPMLVLMRCAVAVSVGTVEPRMMSEMPMIS